MAREPVAAREQEILDEEIEGQGDEGSGDRGQEREVAGQDGEDAALDSGEEQEAGQHEDVDDDDGEPEPSRGQNRIQRLANENADLKRRLTDLERRPAPQVQQQGSREETDAEFTARIQLLQPEDRIEARMERSERRNQRLIQQTQYQTQDMADKAAYDAKAATDPRYTRYASAVETKRAEFIQQGQLVPREVLLKFLIGERVLGNVGQKEIKKQRAAGQERIDRQRTRPTGSGRSDVQTQRRGGSEAEQRRRRLEDMEI